MWWFWVAAVFVFLMIVGAMSGGSTPTNDSTSQEATTPIVNGEHLLGLTIDEVREEMGIPDDESTMDPTAQQLALGGTSTWTNQYTVSDHTIVLDFDMKSRQVTGFFIGTDEKDGITRDWKALLPLSGLSEDAQGYSIKPIGALKSPGFYTGVQATE